MSSGSPLHRAIVTAEGVSPRRFLLVLHGILGSGGNLRSLARRLAAVSPSWGFVLVDLRLHGLSQDAAPPHTLAAAAADLARLEAELEGPVEGAMGHSFGGKVALAYAALRIEQGARPLENLVVLDASPSARERDLGSTSAILEMLEAMPTTFARREDFLDLVKAQGHGAAIAEWLAMNARRDGDVFRLRLDLPGIRSMLEDYARVDLWSVVEKGDAARRIDFVLGAQSNVVSTADRSRLASVALDGRVFVHLLAGAGHWVHSDDPDGTFAAVAAALAEEGS